MKKRQTQEERITEEKKKFLKAVWTAVDIWGRDLKVPKKPVDPRERVKWCAYAFLHILDNTHKQLPKYKLSLEDEDGNEIVISGELHSSFLELDTITALREILAEMNR